MLKFEKFGKVADIPYDMGLLDGLSDPVIVVNEKYNYVFSRDALLGKVWGGDVYVEARTVDVHIRRLRKALDVNDGPELVRTVRSAGYSLDITPNIM